ncbi:nuclear transport factor 2 family protein [Microbacter sp. GSS18]|nr:nuclear transport factor 2 family protein [Microbacter sp. GSS18]
MTAADRLPIPDELRDRIADYPRVASTGDVEATGAYLTDDFSIVFVRPDEQVVTKAGWLALLPEIETRDYRVLNEVITRSAAGFATHHVLVHMDTTMRGVERAGEFAMTDVWTLGEDDVWRLWQRHSVPLAATTLPV